MARGRPDSQPLKENHWRINKIMKQKTYLGAISATVFALGACTSAIASNYTVGGPIQSHYFLPNWGANGQTVSIIPTLEGMTTVTAGPPGSKPAHMVPDPKGQFMFSINHGGNSLSVFDAKSGEFIKQIITGSENSKKGQGHQYYWSPDGDRLYVTELDDDSVVEIDARKLEVSRRAEDVADFPFGMVPAWDEGYLYVIGEGPGPVEVERPGNSVTQLDLATFKPLKKIQVGKAPHAAAYTNGKVYVGNIAKGHRSVSVIDAAKGEVVKTIDVDYENPHFLEEPASGNHLLIVASKEVPELVLIDVRSDEVVGHFKAEEPDIGLNKIRHPIWNPSGESLYFPIGFNDGSSRIYQISVPDLKVLSISDPAPTVVHMLQWNKDNNRMYAASEGNAKKGIPPGVSIFKSRGDGSLKKLADIFADLPDGEEIKGHHGSLN